MKKIILIFTLIINSVLISQAQVSIKNKYKKGDVFEYQTKMKNKIQFEIFGDSSIVDNELDIDYVFNVTDVNKTLIEIDASYSNFRATTRNFEVAYTPQDDHMLKTASFLLGLSHRGEVYKMSNLESMVYAVVSDLNIKDPQKAQDTYSVVNGLAGSIALKSSIDRELKVMPDKEVNIGDSWDIVYRESIVNGIIINQTYTLKSVDNNIANIEVEGTITLDKNIPMSEVEFRGILNGKVSGMLQIDTKTGLIVSNNVSGKAEGKLVYRTSEIPFYYETKMEVNGLKTK